MARFLLQWGPEVPPSDPEQPVRSLDSAGRSMGTGELTLAVKRNGLLALAGRYDIRFILIDEGGRECPGVVESSSLEPAGPLRSTLALKGAFRAPAGERVVGFRLRASLFAGLSRILLEPHILMDAERGAMHRIRGLYLEIAPRSSVDAYRIGEHAASRVSPGGRVRLLQVDDETYRFEGMEGGGSRARGLAEVTDRTGTLALALRHFREQWPKSLEVDSRALRVGLFPEFRKGAFDHMKPWYKHQYLFSGDCYRLREGQSRRWQLWLDLAGNGDSLARLAEFPLIPAANPGQAIGTGVWGPMAPAGSPGMADYDRWAENLFTNGYVKSIETQRDYGAMNWGDWWGERGSNWGNHEYDTPLHILIQFARTGDPRYFHVGDTAARHTSEVDVIQFVNQDLIDHFKSTVGLRSDYPVRPGMVHQHCVGHVSGFYPVERIRELYVSKGVGKSKRPYLCLDPYNLGHIWTQGMVHDYFLTGDPWMRETVEKIGANLADLVEARQFQFKGHSHCGRVNGWTMLAIAGAYELDFDKRYLKAMKLLADDALSEQDPRTGGWSYKLPWGHCYCDQKHWGEAAFIGAIRLNGLSKYYALTGDRRIPEAVRRGVTHLNRETWEAEYSGWRYTSCPRSASGPGRQTGVIVMSLVNSVTLTGDEDHLRILRQAWDAKFKRLRVAPTSRPGLGKAYSTMMYGCPEAMHLFVNGLKK